MLITVPSHPLNSLEEGIKQINESDLENKQFYKKIRP